MPERSAWRRMPNLTAITHDSEADPDYAKALRKWRALPATTRKTVPTLRRYWAQTLRRRFAIESGEIEGIYRLRQDAKRRLEQEGFEHVQESDQVRITHPKERLRALLNDELAAIDTMREHAASGEALDIDAIRTWQATATAHQRERTVEVESDEGTVTRLRVPMIPGRLKTNENIIVHDGVEYEFCPPEQVETELAHVLACDDRHRSAAIATARCAAWLHAAFNNVHPFPDGNGTHRTIALRVGVSARRRPPATDHRRGAPGILCRDAKRTPRQSAPARSTSARKCCGDDGGGASRTCRRQGKEREGHQERAGRARWQSADAYTARTNRAQRRSRRALVGAML